MKLRNQEKCYPCIQFRLPCTPRTTFYGCQIVHWDPLNAKRRCPKNGMGYVKMHGSMATNSEYEDGRLPTKLLISQLIIILVY